MQWCYWLTCNAGLLLCRAFRSLSDIMKIRTTHRWPRVSSWQQTCVVTDCVEKLTCQNKLQGLSQDGWLISSLTCALDTERTKTCLILSIDAPTNSKREKIAKIMNHIVINIRDWLLTAFSRTPVTVWFCIRNDSVSFIHTESRTLTIQLSGFQQRTGLEKSFSVILAKVEVNGKV